MLNLLAVPKRNAMSNGFSLAGNTAGAICVFFLISTILDRGYKRSMTILSGAGAVCLFFSTSLYLIPLRYTSKFADQACKAQTTGNLKHPRIWIFGKDGPNNVKP
jgi:hypothetical protein